MKRAKLTTILTLSIIAALTVAVFAEMQQPGQRKADKPVQQQAGRKRLERVADRLAEELNLTEAEQAVVMPEIKKLVRLKLVEMPKLRRLKAIRRKKTATDEEIAAGLKRFRTNLANAQAKIAEAESKLMDMKEITPRRELILTIYGILDNGMGLRMPASARVVQKKETVEQSAKERKTPGPEAEI